jgi:putative oxidoreductase
MKKLFLTTYNKQSLDLGILLIRIAVAAMMLAHGIPKMITLFSGGAVQFPSVFGMSPELSLGLAVFAEVACSLLILVGLGTRFAVIPLAITMMVAAFSIHAADPFTKKELALHYLVAYAVLFFTGSGKYSLDHLLQYKLVGNYPRRHRQPSLQPGK